MSSAQCPPALKGIAHYLKIAEDHDNRDVVISYWCRLYALEVAMQISGNNKTPEINKYLLSIMDWLESIKSKNLNNDCITNKTCAQSYMEEYSLKLFKYGDEQDEAENYGKNVVKAFYTAGILMDVLGTFDELDEEMQEKRKYAKWKAAYIHNCLKVGEKPTPGSYGNKPTDFIKISDEPVTPANDNINGGFTMPSLPTPPSQDNDSVSSQTKGGFNTPINSLINSVPHYDPNAGNFAPATSYVPQPVAPTTNIPAQILSSSGANLNPEQMQKAQKYCKWATSALNYDDVKTAVDNLQKALTLLQTGVDVE